MAGKDAGSAIPLIVTLLLCICPAWAGEQKLVTQHIKVHSVHNNAASWPKPADLAPPPSSKLYQPTAAPEHLIEELLFGIVAINNGSDAPAQEDVAPITEVILDGYTVRPEISAYAMSIYGMVVPGKPTDPPVKKLKIGMNNEIAAANKAKAQRRQTLITPEDTFNGTIGNHKMYKGFLASADEVLGTITSPDDAPYNGVELAPKDDRFFAHESAAAIGEDGVDMNEVSWTRVVTTVMVALKVSELPANLTLSLDEIFQDYFGTVTGLTVNALDVAYGEPSDPNPTYHARLQPDQRTVHVMLDPMWKAGMDAAQQRYEKLSKATSPPIVSVSEPTPAGDDEPSPAPPVSTPPANATDDDAPQSGSTTALVTRSVRSDTPDAPADGTIAPEDNLVMSMEVAFSRSARSVQDVAPADNAASQAATPEVVAADNASPQANLVPFQYTDHTLFASAPDPYVSFASNVTSATVSNARINNSIPMYAVYAAQRNSTQAYVDQEFGYVSASIVSPVLVWTFLVCVLAFSKSRSAMIYSGGQLSGFRGWLSALIDADKQQQSAMWRMDSVYRNQLMRPLLTEVGKKDNRFVVTGI